MTVLVTYVDDLDSVAAAAVADTEYAAGQSAWRELLLLVDPDIALGRYRRELRLLPPGANVRYAVMRTNGAQPVPVCSYGQLATALSAVRALSPLTDYTYGVRVDVRTSVQR